jgi:hypothetical protein
MSRFAMEKQAVFYPVLPWVPVNQSWLGGFITQA